MDTLDDTAVKVFEKNRALLGSVLDGAEVLLAAESRGLLSLEEAQEMQRCGPTMEGILAILLERRPATAGSPIGVRSAVDVGSPPGNGQVNENVFFLFLRVLEMKEEYKSWAKYLKGKANYRLMKVGPANAKYCWLL